MRRFRFSTSRILTAVAFLAVVSGWFREANRAMVAEQQIQRQTVAAERLRWQVSRLESMWKARDSAWQSESEILLRHLLRRAVDARAVILSIAETDYATTFPDSRPLSEMYDVTCTLQEDGWHVDCGFKEEFGAVVAGGGPHYVVDPESGRFRSKHYDQ